MTSILVLEDDTTFAQILQGFLNKNGYDVHLYYKCGTALSALSEKKHDLLLLDYRLPDGTGLEVLYKAREMGIAAPAIMMTGFNDVRTAVKAMRSGALDYITKPVNPDELLMIIRDVMNPDAGKPEKKTKAATEGLIEGNSEEAGKLAQYIRLVAPTDMSVILRGESGTGKEHAARSIHQYSKRSDGPFFAIDCGTLSRELAASELFGHVKGAFTGALQDKKGQFEAADGGTLFLDEIGNLSYDVQVKLLRALQEKMIRPVGSDRQVKIDVRIIAATNDDLPASIRRGDFREDLYHRLNEFTISVPALRSRDKDIDLFVDHFIKQANASLSRQVKGVSGEVMELFRKYDWPGNLRELKNVVKRMVLLADGETAGIETLPEEMNFSVLSPPDPVMTSDLKALQEFNEKELIEKTLREVRYNKTKAAKILNIDRKTLYNKLEKYGIG
jgi:two-component system response regulator HydG